MSHRKRATEVIIWVSRSIERLGWRSVDTATRREGESQNLDSPRTSCLRTASTCSSLSTEHTRKDDPSLIRCGYRHSKEKDELPLIKITSVPSFVSSPVKRSIVYYSAVSDSSAASLCLRRSTEDRDANSAPG